LAQALLRIFLFTLWIAAAAYYFISAFCLASFYRRKKEVPSYLPPMTVLKPLKGIDEKTVENLLSFLNQDYPAFQVIFGVTDGTDPAREVAAGLAANHQGIDIEVVAAPTEAQNEKAGNLANMCRHAKYDIIVIADADMHVGPDYLRTIAGGFDGPEVGLVTCPYRAARPESMGAAFESLTINSDFLPSVTVAERLEGLSFGLGATMAVRREALAEIGGFEALADYLADDYQLGNRVKRSGYSLRLSRYVVDSVQGQESLSGYFSHQLRWGRTYRACRPGSYFLSVLTKGTAFAVFFLVASGFSIAGWAVLGTDLAMRYCQALYMEARLIRAPGVMKYYWLLPLKDLLSFIIWGLSFTGNTVRWKDSRYRIDSEGRMKRLSGKHS